VNDPKNIQTLGETENYVAWTDTDDAGETVYHLELNTVTLHFFREDWDELLGLMDEIIAKGGRPASGKPSHKR
jgi:hypothetical protein